MSMGVLPKVYVEDEQAAGALRGYSGPLVVYIFGVFLNYLVPSRVFEIVLNVAAHYCLYWAFIVVCQMRLQQSD